MPVIIPSTQIGYDRENLIINIDLIDKSTSKKVDITGKFLLDIKPQDMVNNNGFIFNLKNNTMQSDKTIFYINNGTAKISISPLMFYVLDQAECPALITITPANKNTKYSVSNVWGNSTASPFPYTKTTNAALTTQKSLFSVTYDEFNNLSKILLTESTSTFENESFPILEMMYQKQEHLNALEIIPNIDYRSSINFVISESESFTISLFNIIKKSQNGKILYEIEINDNTIITGNPSIFNNPTQTFSVYFNNGPKYTPFPSALFLVTDDNPDGPYDISGKYSSITSFPEFSQIVPLDFTPSWVYNRTKTPTSTSTLQDSVFKITYKATPNFPVRYPLNSFLGASFGAGPNWQGSTYKYKGTSSVSFRYVENDPLCIFSQIVSDSTGLFPQSLHTPPPNRDPIAPFTITLPEGNHELVIEMRYLGPELVTFPCFGPPTLLPPKVAGRDIYIGASDCLTTTNRCNLPERKFSISYKDYPIPSVPIFNPVFSNSNDPSIKYTKYKLSKYLSVFGLKIKEVNSKSLTIDLLEYVSIDDYSFNFSEAYYRHDTGIDPVVGAVAGFKHQILDSGLISVGDYIYSNNIMQKHQGCNKDGSPGNGTSIYPPFDSMPIYNPLPGDEKLAKITDILITSSQITIIIDTNIVKNLSSMEVIIFRPSPLYDLLEDQNDGTFKEKDGFFKIEETGMPVTGDNLFKEDWAFFKGFSNIPYSINKTTFFNSNSFFAKNLEYQQNIFEENCLAPSGRTYKVLADQNLLPAFHTTDCQKFSEVTSIFYNKPCEATIPYAELPFDFFKKSPYYPHAILAEYRTPLEIKQAYSYIADLKCILKPTTGTGSATPVGPTSLTPQTGSTSPTNPINPVAPVVPPSSTSPTSPSTPTGPIVPSGSFTPTAPSGPTSSLPPTGTVPIVGPTQTNGPIVPNSPIIPNTSSPPRSPLENPPGTIGAPFGLVGPGGPGGPYGPGGPNGPSIPPYPPSPPVPPGVPPFPPAPGTPNGIGGPGGPFGPNGPGGLGGPPFIIPPTTSTPSYPGGPGGPFGPNGPYGAGGLYGYGGLLGPNGPGGPGGPPLPPPNSPGGIGGPGGYGGPNGPYGPNGPGGPNGPPLPPTGIPTGPPLSTPVTIPTTNVNNLPTVPGSIYGYGGLYGPYGPLGPYGPGGPGGPLLPPSKSPGGLNGPYGPLGLFGPGGPRGPWGPGGPTTIQPGTPGGIGGPEGAPLERNTMLKSNAITHRLHRFEDNYYASNLNPAGANVFRANEPLSCFYCSSEIVGRSDRLLGTITTALYRNNVYFETVRGQSTTTVPNGYVTGEQYAGYGMTCDELYTKQRLQGFSKTCNPTINIDSNVIKLVPYPPTGNNDPNIAPNNPAPNTTGGNNLTPIGPPAGTPGSPNSGSPPGTPVSPNAPTVTNSPGTPNGPYGPNGPGGPNGPSVPPYSPAPPVPPGVPPFPPAPGTPGGPGGPNGPFGPGGPGGPGGPAINAPGTPGNPGGPGGPGGPCGPGGPPVPPTSIGSPGPGCPGGIGGPGGPNGPGGPGGPNGPGGPFGPNGPYGPGGVYGPNGILGPGGPGGPGGPPLPPPGSPGGIGGPGGYGGPGGLYGPGGPLGPTRPRSPVSPTTPPRRPHNNAPCPPGQRRNPLDRYSDCFTPSVQPCYYIGGGVYKGNCPPGVPSGTNNSSTGRPTTTVTLPSGGCGPGTVKVGSSCCQLTTVNTACGPCQLCVHFIYNTSSVCPQTCLGGGGGRRRPNGNGVRNGGLGVINLNDNVKPQNEGRPKPGNRDRNANPDKPAFGPNVLNPGVVVINDPPTDINGGNQGNDPDTYEGGQDLATIFYNGLAGSARALMASALPLYPDKTGTYTNVADPEIVLMTTPGAIPLLCQFPALVATDPTNGSQRVINNLNDLGDSTITTSMVTQVGCALYDPNLAQQFRNNATNYPICSPGFPLPPITPIACTFV